MPRFSAMVGFTSESLSSSARGSSAPGWWSSSSNAWLSIPMCASGSISLLSTMTTASFSTKRSEYWLHCQRFNLYHLSYCALQLLGCCYGDSQQYEWYCNHYGISERLFLHAWDANLHSYMNNYKFWQWYDAQTEGNASWRKATSNRCR